MDEKDAAPKYPFSVQQEQVEDHVFWTAVSAVLDGCAGQGETVEEAIRELAVNEEVWIEAANAHDIPAPKAESEPKTWEEYKDHVKRVDPNGARDIALIEAAARSIAALQTAQEAFAGAAEEAGIQSEDDVVRLVSDLRKEQKYSAVPRKTAMRSDQKYKQISVSEPDVDWRNMVVGVKLVDGTRLLVRRSNIVGCCHYHLHPGKLTKRLLLEHDCLGKQCVFLEKYDDATYWAGLRNKQKSKEDARKRQMIIKEQKARTESRMKNIQREMQRVADDNDYVMEIIRVERLGKVRYRVFYVSDNRFADGNRFPEFFKEIHRRYPSWRLDLRHIKDTDGHFVTREEYHTKHR